MGAVQHVREVLSEMKRSKGETDEEFAERRYNMQMEIYSAYAMTDLWKPFWQLPEKIQKQWIKGVRNGTA